MRSLWDHCREPLRRRINTLRFPYLPAATAPLFVIDLIFPDVIPRVDEILLGLGTWLLACLRREPSSKKAPESHDATA